MSVSGILSVNPTVRQRRWWVALAIFALAFLSLRPACETWLSHWSAHAGQQSALTHAVGAHAPMHAPGDPVCCATIESRSVISAFDALILQSGPGKLAAMSLAVLTLRKAPVPSTFSLTASVIPPGSPPYYARSARILR